MAYNAGQSQMVGDKKFIDPLIADLITLSYECKRKYSPVKEVMFFLHLSVTFVYNCDSNESFLSALNNNIELNARFIFK